MACVRVTGRVEDFLFNAGNNLFARLPLHGGGTRGDAVQGSMTRSLPPLTALTAVFSGSAVVFLAF